MAELESGAGVFAKVAKRLLALLALAAAIVAVAMLVSNRDDDGEISSRAVGGEVATPVKEQEQTPKDYVIEAGDTLDAIATRYEISVERIERLNPNLDTNTLATGDVLTLR